MCPLCFSLASGVCRTRKKLSYNQTALPLFGLYIVQYIYLDYGPQALEMGQEMLTICYLGSCVILPVCKSGWTDIQLKDVPKNVPCLHLCTIQAGGEMWTINTDNFIIILKQVSLSSLMCPLSVWPAAPPPSSSGVSCPRIRNSAIPQWKWQHTQNVRYLGDALTSLSDAVCEIKR